MEPHLRDRGRRAGVRDADGRFTIQNKAVNPAWSARDEPWAGAYRN